MEPVLSKIKTTSNPFLIVVDSVVTETSRLSKLKSPKNDFLTVAVADNVITRPIVVVEGLTTAPKIFDVYIIRREVIILYGF